MGRLDRAKANHHDNIAMFAAVILVTHVAGKNDDVTARLAQGLLITRLAYLFFYYFGLVPFRSIAYFMGMICVFTMVVHIWE